MTYKERRAVLDKLEKAIDKDLAYDRQESLPDKYSLNPRLISGDEYAKEMVLNTYKNMRTLYGIYTPLYLKMSFAVIFALALIHVIGVALIVHFLIEQSPKVDFAVVIEIGFIIVSILICKFLENKKIYVYMYKVGRKNIIIYKDVKKDITTVYMNKKQVYQHEFEEWQQVERPKYMGGRLLFQYLCGELMIKQRRKGITEIYCCNRAPFEWKFKKHYEKSARLLLKNGKPWIIDYYFPAALSNSGYFRSISSERLELVEINTDRVAEVPKSFLTFCQKRGIEPLEENEHLRYV